MTILALTFCYRVRIIPNFHFCLIRENILEFKKNLLISFLAVSIAANLTACGGGNDDDTGGAIEIGKNGAVDVNTQGSFAVSMLSAVNAARAQPRNCGGTQYPAAAPLSWNVLLSQSAAWYANDMAQHNYFNSDHTSSDGRHTYERISSTGYKNSYSSENIGAGQSSVNQVMAQWLSSSGHCSAIMSPNAKEMGASRAVKSGTAYKNYWVQNFGAP